MIAFAMQPAVRHALLASLRADEGLKLDAYDDATGAVLRAPRGNATIGYGTLLPLRPEEADYLLQHRLDLTLAELVPDLSTTYSITFANLPDDAQIALGDAAYQLGAPRLMEFRRMLGAVHAGDWQKAADEVLRSRWDRETPRRCERVAARLRALAPEPPS